MALNLIAGAAIQALPAITGLIGNLIGRKKRKKMDGMEDDNLQQFSQLTDIFKSQMGGDYFDSGEAQGAMKEIDQNSDDNMDQINGTANINGLTDEAKIAMMGQNMKAKQGAYSGLAQNAGLWRQRATQNYQGALGNLFSATNTVKQQRNARHQQSVGNIVNGFQGAIDGATNAGVFDNLGKKTPKFSGVGPAAAINDLFANKILNK